MRDNTEETEGLSETARYGVVDRETLRSQSGLEFLAAMTEGRLPRPPIMRLLDFNLTEFGEGWAHFVGIPGDQHYNPIGSVHGGYAATLLDSCMGCAVHSALPRGTGYTTLEFKISFIKAMTNTTGPVRAEGRTIAVGKRVATAEGSLRDAEGRLLAHGTTTCLVFPL
ncbi:MAG TPA: PaaI family thioesterase [Acetobacteraceae bacterium]|nr:PaaI family thioesterase [Acetobacteraceae bacterium]